MTLEFFEDEVPAKAYTRKNEFTETVAGLNTLFDATLGRTSKAVKVKVPADGVKAARSQIQSAAHALPIRRSPRIQTIATNDDGTVTLRFWLVGFIPRGPRGNAAPAEGKKGKK